MAFQGREKGKTESGKVKGEIWKVKGEIWKVLFVLMGENDKIKILKQVLYISSICRIFAICFCNMQECAPTVAIPVCGMRN